ncbi:MAG: trehalase / alfa-L-rhamnosidase / mannosyl oligosaccharide glucosidase, partial [Clostridia bacterium]|nr:trehalase / alfa-L-rhamnosidase / mannosyl oligosaccharide glucosidase [Clostridia bacterium]
LSHFKGVLKPPVKNLKHPFIVPGTGYTTELWSWDAYWEALSLKRSFEIFGEEEMTRAGVSFKTACAHMQGSVLDFLDAQEKDGFIPIMVSAGGLFEGFFKDEYDKGTPLNQCLPFLCQFALLAGNFVGGFDWFDIEKLIKYMQYFEVKQYDKNSGLFFWQDDIMIGIDNNPTVFYRPQRSGADIYLNSFIYLEYISLAAILDKINDNRAADMKAKAEKLKAAINGETWDERDGIYYSQDINFYKTERIVKGVALHSGLDPHWNTMPLKIRFWGCFLPMYAGICSAEQAERMCAHLTENDDIFAEYGIRTLAKNEKMYSLVKSQGNPSNWLGAIWTIANYCVYKGLARYGKRELAESLKSATFDLLNKNLKEHGDLFESYHPDTGEPFMHPGFLSHNLPVIDML